MLARSFSIRVALNKGLPLTYSIEIRMARKYFMEAFFRHLSHKLYKFNSTVFFWFAQSRVASILNLLAMPSKFKICGK